MLGSTKKERQKRAPHVKQITGGDDIEGVNTLKGQWAGHVARGR